MKPSLPQGTRDFEPAVVRKRQYIFNTIRAVFEVYGFEPLETPALENIETLLGKYGEEGDKLMFKILNNGLSDPKNSDKATAAFEKVLQGKTDKHLTERALKYDLTIPFARYVATHHAQLTLPFRRYQIQPVWRADRPQKGRYREFYQCDADVVGSDSPLNEVELIHLYATVFNRLRIPVTIKINHRKILAALAEVCGGVEKMMAITMAIDKLDKIGIEKVKEELAQRELTLTQIATIETYLLMGGSNAEKLAQLEALLGSTQTGKQGIEEIKYILHYLLATDHLPLLHLDLSLARGLNYYTGIIVEVKANSVKMGSLGGGGRYDNLTGLFGVPNIPGVGISFGVDRIYDVLEELQLFPPTIQTTTTVLFFNLGETESRQAFALMQALRNEGIAAELYHEATKFDKQFKYAEKKQIPFIAILGSKELAEKTCVVKQLSTGTQQTVKMDELVGLFKQEEME
jgi:histidyl-tRNA synthetase